MSFKLDPHEKEVFNGYIEGVTMYDKYPDSKADIITYYQEEYGAKWKVRLTSDLAQFTGMKKKSLEKRFDTQRRGNPEKKNIGQYRAFGETLKPYKVPKKLPNNGGSVHFTGDVYYSDDAYEKDFTVDLDDEQMNDFLEGDMSVLFYQYGMNMNDIQTASISDLDINLDGDFNDAGQYEDEDDYEDE